MILPRAPIAVPVSVRQAAAIARRTRIDCMEVERRWRRYRGPRWASFRTHLQLCMADLRREHAASSKVVRQYLAQLVGEGVPIDGCAELLPLQLSLESGRRIRSLECKRCPACLQPLHGVRSGRGRRRYCGRRCRSKDRKALRRRRRS